ncbi:MAG: rod shape-determining protein MreC [Proteobacteria bacterium]|nr:rod shape-determining protein MreC [Pseudomonadota bacterium]
MRPKNATFAKKYRLFLLALVLLFASFIMISSSSRESFNLPLFPNLFMEILSPFQRVYYAGMRAVRDLAQNYILLIHVREENEHLKKRLTELERENAELAEMAIANERLRRFLNFKEKIPKPTLPAELIGEDASSWFRTITINKGEIDGVQKGMVVVAAAGLVGHVTNTSRDVSKVLLITDYNSSVDAIGQASRARGIVQGKDRNLCEINYVSRRDEISVGERVITSGLGGRFPKGLIVGTVSRVEKKPYGVFQKVEVSPAVDFKKLEEVFVILDTDDSSNR